MLALLHTSPVHVPVFDALREQDHPRLRLRHFVDEGLLRRARRGGPETVAGDIATVLDRAVAEGAGAVLCTCSTIGAVAETAGAARALPVLRIDRPMAAQAVAAGPRVVVVAAVESTLDPTVALLHQEAERAGRRLRARPLLVPGAWARFEAGDTEGYLRAVAEAADSVTGDEADAVVLAQASMAQARDLTTTSVPVLSSPRRGLAAAARAATRAAGAAAPA
ncbi:aspartate/glutamate racemase family protein [Streptomyces sp. NPDC006743]|uniref:aspartate/glutamate racemase family protein n=1 Tax=Streptomyces sp. NPDC006743 TaxID=3154480 RepID=UPI003456D5C1